MVQVVVHGGRVAVSDSAALFGGVAVLPVAMFAIGRLEIVPVMDHVELRWRGGEGCVALMLSYPDIGAAETAAATLGARLAEVIMGGGVDASMQGGQAGRQGCHPAWRGVAMLAMAALVGGGAFTGGLAWKGGGAGGGKGVEVAASGSTCPTPVQAAVPVPQVVAPSLPAMEGVARVAAKGNLDAAAISALTREAERRVQEQAARIAEERRADMAAGGAPEVAGNPSGVFVPLE